MQIDWPHKTASPLVMANEFLVGVAVGYGLVSGADDRGGADFLLAINAGRMRNMGSQSVAGMLPIADATNLTESFAKDEVLSQCSVPVYIGVNVMGENNNPECLVDRAVQQGFDGVVNFPSSMHYGPSMQHILEQGKRGIAREVEVLAEAKSRGLKTLYYCANRTQARLGADAGLDMIMLNFGWNAGGAFGPTSSSSLEEVAFKALAIGRFIKRIHPSTQFLLEGGPIVTSEDLARVIKLADVDGYVGGSTIDRLPVDYAVSDLIAAYRLAGRRERKTGSEEQKLLAYGKTLGVSGQSAALLDCLNKLQTVASLNTPVFLSHHAGADLKWCIQAIERGSRTTGVQILRPGAEDRHGVAGRRLFGAIRDGVGRLGALADPDCGLIIIHAPERLSPRTQRRLARAIREARFTAPGSRRMATVTSRCLFASDSWSSNRPPAKLEPELALLLASNSLSVPSLQERQDDISDLIRQRCLNLGLSNAKHPQFTPAAKMQLRSHEWPGNESELYALIDKVVLAPADTDSERLRRILTQGQHAKVDSTEHHRTEKARIVDALWRHNFHRGRTAQALGISRKTLYNKIRQFGLNE